MPRAEQEEPEQQADGEISARHFHRIVRTNPPTEADFRSNAARGRAPRGMELTQPELWTGLSVFDTEARARARAQPFPQLGAYIATLRITPADPVTVKQTLRTGHYTIWGRPEAILALVITVVPV